MGSNDPTEARPDAFLADEIHRFLQMMRRAHGAEDEAVADDWDA